MKVYIHSHSVLKVPHPTSPRSECSISHEPLTLASHGNLVMLGKSLRSVQKVSASSSSHFQPAPLKWNNDTILDRLKHNLPDHKFK